MCLMYIHFLYITYTLDWKCAHDPVSCGQNVNVVNDVVQNSPPNSQGNMCSFDASQMHIKNPHSAWYHMISILEPYLSPNDMLRLLQPPVFHVASNHRIPTSWFPRVPVVRRSKLMGINSFRWVCHMSHQPIIKPASTEIGAINST